MDPNKFTQKTNDAIAAAQSLAVRSGQQQIEVEHLLLALVEQEKGIVSKILEKAQLILRHTNQPWKRKSAGCPGSAAPAPSRARSS